MPGDCAGGKIELECPGVGTEWGWDVLGILLGLMGVKCSPFVLGQRGLGRLKFVPGLGAG